MSYKKWVYKYKYLKTEESEFAEKMQKYTAKFHEDFETIQKEVKPIIQNLNTTSSKESNLEDLEPKSEKKGKDLYKELAKEFHPDKGGTEDDFKDLNSMYEDENVLGMYVKAEELGIKIEVIDEEELEETFSKTCNSLQSKIQGYQTTAAWRWATVKDEQREMLALAIEQQANVKRRKK